MIETLPNPAAAPPPSAAPGGGPAPALDGGNAPAALERGRAAGGAEAGEVAAGTILPNEFARFAVELARAVALEERAVLEPSATTEEVSDALPATEDLVPEELPAEAPRTDPAPAVPLVDAAADIRVELQLRGVEQRAQLTSTAGKGDGASSPGRANEAAGRPIELAPETPVRPEASALPGDAALVRPTPRDAREGELREGAATAVQAATREGDDVRRSELPDFSNGASGREGGPLPHDLRAALAPPSQPEFSNGLDGAARPDPTAATNPSDRTAAAPSAPDRVLPEIPARNEQEILSQSRLLFDRAGGRARIQLEPPQLGQLHMKLAVTEHGVRIDITADKAGVAALLTRHLPELQHAFASQGLSIEHANIDLAGRDAQANGRDRAERDATGGSTRDGGGGGRRSGDERAIGPRYLVPAYSLGAVNTVA